MKRLEEKLKRIVKYWRVTYLQANGRERLAVGLFALVMLVYAWWVVVVL